MMEEFEVSVSVYNREDLITDTGRSWRIHDNGTLIVRYADNTQAAFAGGHWTALVEDRLLDV